MIAAAFSARLFPWAELRTMSTLFLANIALVFWIVSITIIITSMIRLASSCLGCQMCIGIALSASTTILVLIIFVLGWAWKESYLFDFGHIRKEDDFNEDGIFRDDFEIY